MAHVKIELDFRQYLHEKAQQSRQNEIQACLMFLAGDLFFVGGIVTNLALTSIPEWLLFIPYHPNLTAGAVLGLSLIISGLSLMILGIAIGVHYHRDRMWYMQELQKAHESAQQKTNLKQKPTTKNAPKTPVPSKTK